MRFIKFILGSLVIALMANFIITWFSAPQLSMNLSESKTAYDKLPLENTCRIDIENRGGMANGVRIFVYIDRTLVDQGLVLPKFKYISKVEYANYYKYQIDALSAIFRHRSGIIGNIVFKITDKQDSYDLPFEIFADKMARRYGNIKITVNKSKKTLSASSSSFSLITRDS